MSLPLWHLPPGPLLLVVDVGAWAVVHSVTGYAVHRLPLRRLDHDTLAAPRPPVRARRALLPRRLQHPPVEGPPARGRRAVRRRDVEAPPAAGDDRGGLERFAVETRRAELGHWLAAAGGPLFVLWNPPPIAVVMVVYGVAVNLPFIAIQRYNRLRIARVLGAVQAGRGGAPSAADTQRSAARPAASMPKGSPPTRWCDAVRVAQPLR